MKVKLVMWFARVLGVPVDVHSSYFMKNYMRFKAGTKA